ncbi:hypothetical protein LUZ60_002256 [Juncus effusus]|nr:hypothetical protein LUZ60_002256 [Juncus effusus]
MALATISLSITCAIPRRLKHKKYYNNPFTKRKQNPALPYPKPSLTPLLPSSPSPPSSPDELLEAAISHLESSSPQLSLTDPSLVLSVLGHVTHPIHVKRLRHVIPLSLLRRHVIVFAKLVELYCKHGFVRNAHHLFDQMPERHRNSSFVWNCLICGYTEMGLYEEAMALYYQMEEDELPPDRYTFPRVLKACSGIGSVSLGQSVHRSIIRAGFGNDIYVLNSLVDMYAKCGDIRTARKVFDVMSERDLISWNSMLVGYLQHGLLKEGLSIWREMINTGFESDPITISALISGFSDSEYSRIVLEVHGWVIRRGFEENLSIGNSLIGFYSKKGKLHLARKVFDEMPKRDLLTWNSILNAHRHDQRILKLFKKMLDSSIKPDKITFVSLLSACANLGFVEKGKKIFHEMQEQHNIWPIKEHYACIVNMLGKKGRVKEAFKFIKTIPFEAGPTIWGALLYACVLHGDLEIAEVASEKLWELEPDNEHNFELMVRIYRKKGRLDGVEKIRRLMEERGFDLVDGL